MYLVISATTDLGLGSIYSLTVSNALGSSFGILAFGLNGSQASIPFFGGTLLIHPILAFYPFTLDGGSSVPGGGSFVLDIPIPTDASILGIELNAQSGILDPGASFSISLTNAVEAKIL